MRYSSRLSGSRAPGEKPETTRAGIPDMRSSSAIAPEKCWQ